MVERIEVAEILTQCAGLPIIDVRSPGEFEKGHIPGAVNIPLFDNDERARVGTTYKQQSKEKALELGYKIVTPKLDWYVTESMAVAPKLEAVVHCWRGGMRSGAFAQHLADHGFTKIYVIEGGYKAFRNLVLSFFEFPFTLNILGGYTGSGKTEMLQCMQSKGHQVVDLERVANHRGSAFGGLGLGRQPSPEQFENLLFLEFQKLDISKPIWLEDESHHIGSVFVPHALFLQMTKQPLYLVDIPIEIRTLHLVHCYGSLEKAGLAESLNKISQRLGSDRVKVALSELEKDNLYEVAKICLEYYDKFYSNESKRTTHQRVITIPLNSTDHCKNAEKVLQVAQAN